MNKPETTTSDDPGMLHILLIFASVVVVVAGMTLATSIITTIFLAFVIAVCATPLLNWLRRKNLPTWLAFSLVCILVVIVIAFLVVVMIFSIEKLINSLPTYQNRIAEIKVNIQSWFNARGIASGQVNDVLSMNVFKPENLVNFSISVATSVGHALSNWGFILFIAGLMLLESISQPDKLRKAMRSDSPMPKRLINFNRNIRSYFVLNAWLGLLVAVLNTVFLTILGVDFAILWGILSFLLSFVPIVGFWISFIPPMFLALLEFGPGRAAIVVIGFIIINTIVDNIINPRIMSHGLNLSPLMVILSLMFWSWILGPIGAILAVPLTLAVKELFLESSDESRWLAVLMEPGGVKIEEAANESAAG